MAYNLNSETYKKFQELEKKIDEKILKRIFRDPSVPRLLIAEGDWNFSFKVKDIYIVYNEVIDNSLFDHYFNAMNEILTHSIEFAHYDENRWHRSVDSLIGKITSGRSNIENTLEKLWNQTLPFIIKDLKKEQQFDADKIKTSSEIIVKDSFESLWIERIKPIESILNKLDSQSTSIKQTIDNIKSEETTIQFKATIDNIEDVKKKNKYQIWIWGTLTTVSIVSTFCTVHYSLEHMNDVFYNSSLLNVSDELKKIYIFKNSLTSLTILGIISFCLVSSLRLLKKHLNINTIYNHKLALLNSFKNLIGEKLFNEQERIKIVEKLVEQIITSDHITLQEQGHSSPSIIQPITEIINGGKQN